MMALLAESKITKMTNTAVNLKLSRREWFKFARCVIPKK